MNVSASFQFDRPYYSHYYSVWIHSRSRWRKWAVPFGYFLLLVTVGLGILWREGWPFTALFIAIACGNCLDAGTYRWRWIRKRLRARKKDCQVKVIFRNDDVSIFGPHSTTTAEYAAFAEIALTSEGIFLSPERGYSFFVPRDAFESHEAFQSTIAFLEQKLSRQESSRPSQTGFREGKP